VTSPAPPPVRLCDAGPIYVTVAAAERYATARQMLIEGARKELTVVLLDAKLVRDGEPQTWRSRSRSTQIDITATVVREGPLLVVVATNVRDYR
jgi:hypothetical protein